MSSGNSYLRVSPIYAALPGNCPDHFLLDESLPGDKKVGCDRCSMTECRTACDMIPACVGFSYANPMSPISPSTRQCYLKSGVCRDPQPGTHIFYHKLPLYV